MDSQPYKWYVSPAASNVMVSGHSSPFPDGFDSRPFICSEDSDNHMLSCRHPDVSTPTPLQNALVIQHANQRTRVETQINIRMKLAALPPGVTKVCFPDHTILRTKQLANPPAARSPDTLELYVQLVRSGDVSTPELERAAFERAARTAHRTHGDIRICLGCMTREKTRAWRKKGYKKDEIDRWLRDQEYRIIVFNTPQLVHWAPDIIGDAASAAYEMETPMRITCYCRHHKETTGFSVIFTLKDWQDRVFAQARSRSIMITDDHKSKDTNNQGGTQRADRRRRGARASPIS
ncbi:hypothetical protein CP532_2855 [Ophiocordyceps camponoti-leonardi (nom. inval.)]|nr:hypothetical protein CP532_2855 [Ophiocordyceps camponoti-leonardi (nom. inval.)]